ncbi:hypothetical protein EYF80_013178 [Liparis tanakae]|uniref:Uncharacterized protein n=1 Tax=Liparis tanakae TaxID=230148 RepID=A0A4Z2IEW6_9TELE|nr:hypothetical protein EYF80_013178 [Liparis tanakae]
MPSVPRAFCLMAMAIRFFSDLVSLRAASIFRLTSLCSLSASKRFSASVPMPSSLDTCSSLCKLLPKGQVWDDTQQTLQHAGVGAHKRGVDLVQQHDQLILVSCQQQVVLKQFTDETLEDQDLPEGWVCGQCSKQCDTVPRDG